MTHPPPPVHRNPGDAWVEGPEGRFWGRFGAAGLLAHDPARGILLQHRVEWSHFGGTWGLPGGARHQDEAAVHGALREATEEAGVPGRAVRVRFTSVLDLGYWSYTTAVAHVERPFEPVISDPESLALDWVPTDAVGRLPLHPGFAAAWHSLRHELDRRAVVVVDAANVVGSRPDGWWKDRRGAAERLAEQLGRLEAAGIPAEQLGLPQHRWWPEIVLVVEGQARGATVAAESRVRMVRAQGSADDAIVDTVRELSAGRGGGHGTDERAPDVSVVTSDRQLRDRVEQLGATARGAGWLLDLLAPLDGA